MVNSDMQEALRDDFKVGDPVAFVGDGVVYYLGTSLVSFRLVSSP